MNEILPVYCCFASAAPEYSHFHRLYPTQYPIAVLNKNATDGLGKELSIR
jgi:hypothetical protein